VAVTDRPARSWSGDTNLCDACLQAIVHSLGAEPGRVRETGLRALSPAADEGPLPVDGPSAPVNCWVAVRWVVSWTWDRCGWHLLWTGVGAVLALSGTGFSRDALV